MNQWSSSRGNTLSARSQSNPSQTAAGNNTRCTEICVRYSSGNRNTYLFPDTFKHSRSSQSDMGLSQRLSSGWKSAVSYHARYPNDPLERRRRSLTDDLVGGNARERVTPFEQPGRVPDCRRYHIQCSRGWHSLPNPASNGRENGLTARWKKYVAARSLGC
jgi:hypothetical protein